MLGIFVLIISRYYYLRLIFYQQLLQYWDSHILTMERHAESEVISGYCNTFSPHKR